MDMNMLLQAISSGPPPTAPGGIQRVPVVPGHLQTVQAPPLVQPPTLPPPSITTPNPNTAVQDSVEKWRAMLTRLGIGGIGPRGDRSVQNMQPPPQTYAQRNPDLLTSAMSGLSR